VKPFDYVAIVVAVLVVGGFSLRAYSESEAGSQVRIQTATNEFVYPLEQDLDLEIEGPLGITHVEIDDGRVRVTESPCREKICIAAGWVSQSGEWIACLPNRVFLRVEGGEETGVDAQTF